MSFYSDMATTVLELLTEFGLSVNVMRPSYNFDDVTNQPTSGGITTTATTGIFLQIDKMPVSGTRIAAGERVIAFVPGYRIQLGDRIDVSMTGDSTATTVGTAPGIILSQGQSGTWSIAELQEINPAGTPLVFFARVTR